MATLIIMTSAGQRCKVAKFEEILDIRFPGEFENNYRPNIISKFLSFGAIIIAMSAKLFTKPDTVFATS
jgi:hypothetical protein